MAPELQSIGPVYDLLYVDSRRLSAYLAQIDPSGNGSLTGIKATSATSDKSATAGKIGIPGTGAEMSREGMASEGIERQFDPIWIVPITTMDRLDELGFINRTLEVPVGSLALVTGFLRLIDIRMLKEMWPAIGKMLSAKASSSNNRHDRRATGQGTANAVPPEFSGMFDLVRHLPHALELHMATLTGGMAWTTLSQDCLLSNPDDMALKYGSAIDGEWHMLAVVDAQPGSSQVADQIWAELPTGVVPAACAQLLSVIRQNFGRPHDAYGVTPLLIFRSLRRPEPKSNIKDQRPIFGMV